MAQLEFTVHIPHFPRWNIFEHFQNLAALETNFLITYGKLDYALFLNEIYFISFSFFLLSLTVSPNEQFMPKMETAFQHFPPGPSASSRAVSVLEIFVRDEIKINMAEILVAKVDPNFVNFGILCRTHFGNFCFVNSCSVFQTLNYAVLRNRGNWAPKRGKKRSSN